MNSGNWSQVKNIVAVAIEQPESARAAFVTEQCSGDADLERHVRQLVDSFEKIGDFMEDGAIGTVADAFASKQDAYKTGDVLGRYRVLKTLGEGGMGTVYLAEDPDLHRKVAVKVLRNDLWWYKQARQRLLREARSAARLDHPNICAIYEVVDREEQSFIVMQYVEGKTLGDIMHSGGLSGKQCIDVALQIADALAEAHSRHIIHRDIKPANIIISDKGQAKVLDFGLAKSIEPGEETRDDLSSAGAVMGTVPYMSPEQLRGKTVDGRSDIFSLGALLFEMTSGHQAFGRENNAETIASILDDEPRFSLVPRQFRPVVEKALKKNAAERYQNVDEMAGDLRRLNADTLESPAVRPTLSNWFGARNAISTAYRYVSSGRVGQNSEKQYYRWQDSDSDARTVPLTESVFPGEATARHPKPTNYQPWLLGGLGVLALATLPFAYSWWTKPVSDPHAFDSLKQSQIYSWKSEGSNGYLGYSTSHNNKMIAYSDSIGSKDSIFVKPVAGGDPVMVTRDEFKNFNPVWSPDDQQIAYISIRERQYGIYTTSFVGGETKLIKPIETGALSIRHWSNDGSAVFYEFNGNLFRLDLATGEAAQLTQFESSRLNRARKDFAFSADEKTLVFRQCIGDKYDLWIMPLAGGGPRQLTNDPDEESFPALHPDGKRVFYSVDRDGHEQIGVAYTDGRSPEQITRGEGEHQFIGLSNDGSTIFYTSWEEHSDVWRINTTTGEESQVAAGKESEFWPDVSPDGSSVLYQTNNDPNPALQDSSLVVRAIDASNAPGIPQRTLSGFDAQWLPDGKHLSFHRDLGSGSNGQLVIADAITGEEKIVVDQGLPFEGYAGMPYNRNELAEFNCSSDGRVAFLVTSGETPNRFRNVYIKDLTSSTQIQITQNSSPATMFFTPMFSPDGKRLAFVSSVPAANAGEKPKASVWIEESGRLKEIYSTNSKLRMVGWSGNNSLIVETADGIAPSFPIEFHLDLLSMSGSIQTIADLKNAYYLSPSVSADGKTIAVTMRANDRDDIFTVPAAGGTPKKISNNNDPRLFYGSPTWSPDGKSIFFDKQDRVNSISMFQGLK